MTDQRRLIFHLIKVCCVCFMISNPHVVCDPAALRLVHQPSCPDCPAADWTTLLLPTQGVLTFCVSVHACQRQRDEQNKSQLISSFNLCPQAVLACINVTSLRQMFLQFQDLPELWRISKIDFVSASVCKARLGHAGFR